MSGGGEFSVETDTCFINKNYFMRINFFIETKDPVSKR